MALINEPSGLVKIIKNLLEKGGGWGVSLSSDEHELICFGFSNPNFWSTNQQSLESDSLHSRIQKKYGQKTPRSSEQRYLCASLLFLTGSF